MNSYNPDQYQTYTEPFDPWEEHPHNTIGLPKRVAGSPQLRLHYESYYRGWAVLQQPKYGGLVENYLERTWEVINTALSEYPRVYAVRVDLRYPKSYLGELRQDNHCMKQFFYYLQWELDRRGLKYPTRVHYVWAREQDRSAHPHYHLLLLLNRDAINQIGNYAPCDEGGYHQHTLYHRIARAWAGALGLVNDQRIEGLVHYAVGGQYDTDSPYGCDDPASRRKVDYRTGQFQIRRGKSDQELARLYYRASYLCKAYSKCLGQGIYSFGSSRRRRR